MKLLLLETSALLLLAAFPADAARVAIIKIKAPTYCAVCSSPAALYGTTTKTTTTPPTVATTTTYVEPAATTGPVIEGGTVIGQ